MNYIKEEENPAFIWIIEEEEEEEEEETENIFFIWIVVFYSVTCNF